MLIYVRNVHRKYQTPILIRGQENCASSLTQLTDGQTFVIIEQICYQKFDVIYAHITATFTFQLFCDKALRSIMELMPTSSFNLILKKTKTMLSETNDLTLWSSKFHYGLSDFDDAALDFQTVDVQILLKTIYQQKCSSSLDALNHTHR